MPLSSSNTGSTDLRDTDVQQPNTAATCPPTAAARLLGEQRPVGGRIDHHRLELAAEHAALLVLILDQHEHHVLQRRLADRHRAGERMQDADFDRSGALRGGGLECRPGTAEGSESGGSGANSSEAAAAEREVGNCHVVWSPSCALWRGGCLGSPSLQVQPLCHETVRLDGRFSRDRLRIIGREHVSDQKLAKGDAGAAAC